MPEINFLRRILLLSFLFIAARSFGQDLDQHKNRLTDSVTEIYHTVKGNKLLMQGLYQAIYQKKTPVASGMYDQNKRIGTWRFFDEKGHLLETYNYDTKQLVYEAPEDTTSSLRYWVDRELKPTDQVTKPIKIGGRYYGYLPYLRLFTLPEGLRYINKNPFKAVVELLVSPLGRLADYKVHIGDAFYKTTINMNRNLPDPADMIFTPATLNGEPIACRIVIQAYITDDNHLDFD